jgi:dihydroorotase
MSHMYHQSRRVILISSSSPRSITRKMSTLPSPLAKKLKSELTGKTFTIPLPDDFHHHFRDSKSNGDGRLETVAPIACEKFHRILAMPNLVPPVVTTKQALEYRERILQCLPKEIITRGFEPLMTLYLTDTTDPKEIDELKATEGKVVAVKLCKFYWELTD